MSAHRLDSSFYARPAAEVARALLGTVLVRETEYGYLRARIVETEAYTGDSDPGSHAYRGPTPRTMVMFGPPGHLYVYFTYGMHFCMNVVTDADGIAGAVLLRAAEPLEGVAIMEDRRGPRPLRNLCDGPAKLCQAFGIARQENGVSLQDSDLWIEQDDYIVGSIVTTSRVGLSAGRDLPLRFYVEGSPFVSPGKPSAHSAPEVGVPSQ